MVGPLEGIKVVELTLMAAGPWTGTLLSELGAEVVKIESPAGDGTRWTHPAQRGMGTNFISMNLGKRDVILDLKNDEDRGVAHRLLAGGDVFVQNLTGGVADRLGVGYEELQTLNPRLVHCSISGYGPGGPLGRERCGAPYIEAYTGLARLTGAEGADLEQFRFTGLMDLVTAAITVESILAALHDRKRTGLGQRIDVSMLEAALELQFTRFSEYLATGVLPEPLGSASQVVAPDQAFAALDRPVFVTVHDDACWAWFCSVLGRPDLIDDPRFAHNDIRVAHRKALDDEIAPIIAAKPAIWWLRSLARHGIAVAVERDFDTLRNFVQVHTNGMIQSVDTTWGAVDVGGLPWKFSRTPGMIKATPQPGADTSWARARTDGVRPPTDGASAAADEARETGPVLAGVRIVELHSSVTGALAGLRLGDLGAEVTKVEPPEGDWLRRVEPRHPNQSYSAVFGAVNRGKRSVRLGGDEELNIALLRQLVATADIVIEDHTDAAAQRYVFPDLSGERERVRRGEGNAIWLEVSDFGAHGPLANAFGSELVVQASAGYTRWLGRLSEPRERLGADVASCATGIFAAQAALAALFARPKRGSQHVALSRMNSLLSLASIHLAAQSNPDAYEGQRVGGEFFEPMRGWSTGGQPIVFQFGGSSGKTGRAGWAEFVTEIGADWMLDDARFASDPTGRESTGHGRKSEELKPVYEEIFAQFSDRDLVDRVRRHGGEAAPFFSYTELLADPQLAYLKSMHTLQESEDQSARVLAFPAHFSDIAIELRTGVPALGSDTEDVARSCGFDEEDVARLLKA